MKSSLTCLHCVLIMEYNSEMLGWTTLTALSYWNGLGVLLLIASLFCQLQFCSLPRESLFVALFSPSSSAVSYYVWACCASGSDGMENETVSVCWLFSWNCFCKRVWFCWNIINPSNGHSWGFVPSAVISCTVHQPAERKHYLSVQKIKIKVSRGKQCVIVTVAHTGKGAFVYSAFLLSFIAPGKVLFSTHHSLQLPYLCNSLEYLPLAYAFSFQQLIFIPESMSITTLEVHAQGLRLLRHLWITLNIYL